MKSTETSFSIISIIAHASFGVQIIMLILFISSIISWKLIFEQRNKIRKAELELEDFDEKFIGTKKIKPKSIDVIYKESKVINSFGIYKILKKSLKFMDSKSSLFNQNVEFKKTNELALLNVYQETFELEVEVVEQNFKNSLSLLGTISSSSPYIGLLGTVMGILMAFWGLGTSQDATIATVAPHIAEALIATAMGLIVAIPALIAYNRLNQRVDVLLDRYVKTAKTTNLILNRVIIEKDINFN